MNDYASLEGLDLAAARAEIAFEVKRDDLITKEEQLQSNLTELVRADTKVSIGTIPNKRKLLPYSELMDWSLNVFEKAQVQYKLKESVLTKFNNLYQTYVFDMPIPTPDGSSMSPMAIIRGSYTGRPATLDFGTYRFVCSNGALVGQTIEHVSFRASQIDELLRSEFHDQLRMKFDLFQKVVEKYSDLNRNTLSAEVNRIVSSSKIGFSMKKAMLMSLEENGHIAFLTEDKLKPESLANPAEVFSVVNEGTGWDVYNVMTALATHKPRSVGGRVSTQGSVSKIFAI